VVLSQPFLSFNKGIMSQLLQDLQSSSAHLLRQFFGITNDNLGLGSDLGHNISQDNLNLGFDGSHDSIDFVLDLIEFLSDLVSQIGSGLLDLLNRIFNGIANLFPEIGEAVVLGGGNLLDDLGQSLSEEFEQKFLNELVVLRKPLLSLQEGIMAELFDGLKSGLTNLNGALFDVTQKLLSLSDEFGHDLLKDDINLGLDGSNDCVDFVCNFSKFGVDSISKSATRFLDGSDGILDRAANVVPEVSPAVVRSDGGVAGHAIFNHLGELFSEEFEEEFLDHFVVLLEPFLRLDQSVVSQLLQDLQSGGADGFGQLFSILEDNLGLGRQDWHDLFHDNLDFRLDRGHDFVDFMLQLVKLFGNFIGQVGAGFLDLLDSLVDGISYLFPEVGPAVRSDHLSLGSAAKHELGELLEDESAEPSLGLGLELGDDLIFVLFEIFDAESHRLLTKVFEEGHNQVADELEFLFAEVNHWRQLRDQRWVDIVQESGGGIL